MSEHLPSSHRTPASRNEDALRHIRVVLVRTSHPGNIGAAARAMWTMGLSRLTLVAPKMFPHEDATAMAAGATRILASAQCVATLDDALAGVALAIGWSARPREFAGRVLAARAAAQEAGEVALVFGTEMSGLTNDELARCALVAAIPANPDYASLNLAAAVQIVAYEIRIAVRGEAVWSSPRFPPATHDEIEGLHQHARATLTAMAFLNPAMPKRLMPRLRRLFARAGLEREEVNILRGILARVDELLGVRDRSADK
jgi:tRNA/rRNA methyltransferase